MRSDMQDILKRTRLVGSRKVHSFVELHIEQGPELEAKVRVLLCVSPYRRALLACCFAGA